MQLVLAALRKIRSPLITQETDLQGIVETALRSAGIIYRREYRMGPRDRIDFVAFVVTEVAGKPDWLPDWYTAIGIECKKGKPNGPDLLRQLSRYCDHERISGMVIVLPWKRHLRLPEAVNGKPVICVGLNELWGLAT